MLDFQEYGVTKTWAIITEISKEVENNSTGRLDAYSRENVSRGLRAGDAGTRSADGGAPDGRAEGSYSGGGSPGRS